MTDFVKAYQTGLEAAEAANKNQEEIDSVFNDLNIQLRKVFDKEINIHVKPCIEKTFDFQKMRDKIVAENPKRGEVIELSVWDQDPCGFPCTITYSNHSKSCENKEALEIALAEMLSDPNIAQSIYKVQIGV